MKPSMSIEMLPCNTSTTHGAEEGPLHVARVQNIPEPVDDSEHSGTRSDLELPSLVMSAVEQARVEG